MSSYRSRWSSISRKQPAGRGSARTLGRLLCVVAVGLLVLLAYPRSAAAYPWMLKHGYGACSTCHVDPSGAELLTPYGRAQGYLLLAMPYGRPVDNPPTGPLWGAVDPPDGILFGGAFQQAVYVKTGRAHKTSYFPMQTDLYGGFDKGPVFGEGSIGLAKVPVYLNYARAAQITRGQGDQLNLVSRTHWLGVHLSENFSLRAGRINLPFGLRMPEHVLWVRSATRTDRESNQQHGLALAFASDRARGEVMAVLGNYQLSPDRFRERGYSAFGEWLVTEAMGIGVSSRITAAAADPISYTRRGTVVQAHGLFGRWAITGPIYLQTEFDLLLRSRYQTGYAGLVQLNLEPTQGLHVIGTYELLDQGKVESTKPTAGAGKPASGAWLSLDYYFAPQVSLRVDTIRRQTTPGLIFLFQLHMYL